MNFLNGFSYKVKKNNTITKKSLTSKTALKPRYLKDHRKIRRQKHIPSKKKLY